LTRTVVIVPDEHTLEAARAADRGVATDSALPPLRGVPFTIKDSIASSANNIHGTWHRPRRPVGRIGVGRVGGDVEQRAHPRHRRVVVGDRMIQLYQKPDATATPPSDAPHLPQRPSAVEELAHPALDRLQQLGVSAGARPAPSHERDW
jgi:hypothetical protein